MSIFMVISLLSMAINEEKQSQQTENEEFVVSDFLFGWFSGWFLGFFPFFFGVWCCLFPVYTNKKYNTSSSLF